MTPKTKLICGIGIGVAITAYFIKNTTTLPINDATKRGAALAVPIGLGMAVIAYLSTHK